jgi:hypothetical protein
MESPSPWARAILAKRNPRTAKRVATELSNQPAVEVDVRLTLASTYNELGLYPQMEAMARQSLQLTRTKLGAENEGVADSLHPRGTVDLGEVTRNQHMFLKSRG